jgi:hypothetical protein
MTTSKPVSKVDQLQLWPVEQRRKQQVIKDITGKVTEEISKSTRLKALPIGSRIAVAVGSRGINHLAEYAKATIATH